MAEELENMNFEQKLRITTYYSVCKICDELGEENSLIGPFTVNREAKQLLTEFILKKMDLYAVDLEAFANHARRNNINSEDVKLLFRRNTKLVEEFAKLDEEEKQEKSKKHKRQSDEEDDT